MAFNVGGFVIGQVIGQKYNITDQATLARLGLVGGLFGFSAPGLVMTSLLAQRSAPSPSLGTPQPSNKVRVPNVKGLATKDAQAKLKDSQLDDSLIRLVAKWPIGEVIYQDPEAGALFDRQGKVKLWVGEAH